MRVDIGVGHHRRMAAGLGFCGTVFCKRHIHAAHPAGTEWLQVGRIAECGYIVVPEISFNESQNCFSFLYRVGFIVDVGNACLRLTIGRSVHKGITAGFLIGAFSSVHDTHDQLLFKVRR